MLLYNHKEREKTKPPREGAKEEKMKRNEFLGLRISPETKKRLTELAEAEGRTLSNFVRLVLDRLVLDKEAKK